MRGTGPTGNFPDGMLKRDDEGEIRMAITHVNGRVIFDFGKQLSWVGLLPDQADALADALKEHARKARLT